MNALIAAIFTSLFTIASPHIAGLDPSVQPSFALGGYDEQGRNLPAPKVIANDDGNPAVLVRFVPPFNEHGYCMLYEAIRPADLSQVIVGRALLTPKNIEPAIPPFEVHGDPVDVWADLPTDSDLRGVEARRETVGTYTIVAACRAGEMDATNKNAVKWSFLYRAPALLPKS